MANILGRWQVQKGRLWQKFAMLTKNDSLYHKGKKEEMMGRMQQKLGKTRGQINEILLNL